MNRGTPEKRAAFRALHKEGCFVLPNPWDVGSARMLQHLGFSALASSSTGYAWATGRPDYTKAVTDVLQHLALLCAAVDLPVNADFESGFAADPEGLASNVRRAIETGVAGLSIEDRMIEGSGLYDAAFSVERIRAARAAIDQSGEEVILVARTEGLLSDPGAIRPAIDKLVAFAEAGAAPSRSAIYLSLQAGTWLHFFVVNIPDNSTSNEFSKDHVPLYRVVPDTNHIRVQDRERLGEICRLKR
jgi:2-methylisocitrate lyase-like PEP mutase family enzyme